VATAIQTTPKKKKRGSDKLIGSKVALVALWKWGFSNSSMVLS